MKKIAYQAENCNGDSTASTKNNAAFVESAFDESIADRGGEEQQKGKTHGFSNTLARTKNSAGKLLGWNAAIVLRYLSNASRRYGKVIDGKRWVRVNLDHISEQYPYMGRSTVDDNIAYLEEFGCCEKMNGVAGLKSRKNDRTRCYHIPKQWMDAAEEEPRYFDSGIAKHVKVPAAVIYFNFQHWIGECKERKVVEEVQLPPATLMGLMPFSESTIKRSLKTLEHEDYLHPVAGKTCWYADGPDKLRGSKPDDRGSKPDTKGPNSDEKGSEPDNYKYCNRLIDELENDSKIKPPALVFENASDDKEAKHEQIHSLHESISPCADEQDRKEMRHDSYAALGFAFAISSPSVAQVHQPEFIDSISPFDELMALQNQVDAAAPASSVEVPSAENMDDAVEDVNNPWPRVHSLEELHRINEGTSVIAKEFLRKLGMQQKFALSVQRLGLDTMTSVPGDVLDELSLNADGDEIMDAILPYFHGVLGQTPLDPFDPLSQAIFHGTLECLVGAFLWPKKHGDAYPHPIPSLIGVTYKLQIILWRRDENQRLAAVAEELAERREEYASVDADKEYDADLAPAEKMRVFRNALHSMNKVGWIWFDQTLQTDRIKVTKVGLSRIQKLFGLNPDLTPADLLPIMKACMKLYAGQPAPPKKFKWKTKWHARMAHRLDIFARYLKTIAKQLGITSPVKVYPNDEQQDEEDVVLAA